MKCTLYVFLISSLIFACQLDTKLGEKPKRLQKVIVAYYEDDLLYMPLYLANEKGCFKEEGLEIKVLKTGSNHSTLEAIFTHNAQFGVVDPISVVIANDKGHSGKVIASVAGGIPFWGITNRQDLVPFTNDKQLKGLKIATYPSPSIPYMLQSKMLEDAGLHANILQLLPIDLIPILETKSVDVVLGSEPYVSNSIRKGGKILYSMASRYGEFALLGIVVDKTMIKDKPEVVQKFVNALQKAEQFGFSHPDSVMFYTQKYFPYYDHSLLKASISRMIADKIFSQNVLISPEAWEKAYVLHNEVGDIKTMENIFSAYDSSFAIKAVKKFSKN